MAAGAAMCLAAPAFAQLDLPPRPAGAKGGTQVKDEILTMTRQARERHLFSEIAGGNVPDFLRRLVPITTTATLVNQPRTATYYVTPDYLAVGSDTDHFRVPMSPVLAQQLADRAGCTLPTKQMVDEIYAAAPVKLEPAPIPPSAEMITVGVFWQHEELVRLQRSSHHAGLGALVAGHKKDVILSVTTPTRPPPLRVCIYGWHKPGGVPIQPLSTVHENTYADYSHGIRLVGKELLLDGTTTTPLASVLMSNTLHPLFSHEGLWRESPAYPVPPPDVPGTSSSE